MATLLNRSLSLYYLAFSLAGSVMLLWLSSSEPLNLANTATILLLSGRWEELALAIVAAAIGGFFLRRLLKEGGKAKLRATDILLFLFSLLVLVSAAAAAWRYLSFQPVAGVALPGIQVNVWGYSVDYVQRNILVEGVFLFLIAPLALMATELRRGGKILVLLRAISVAALTAIILFGAFAALPIVQDASGYSFLLGAGEWPLAIDMAFSDSFTGTGVGTYFAEAGNHSVLLGKPQQPTPAGPGFAGKLAAEIGLYIAGLFLAAIFLFVKETFGKGTYRYAFSGALLCAAALVFFTSMPFVREAVFLCVLLCGLMVKSIPDERESGKPSAKQWLGFAAVILVIFLPGICLSSLALDPMKSWERLRWPLEAGFFAEEGEGGFRWTGAAAVKSLTPDRRFLHLEWFVGDRKAENYEPEVSFYWDGRLVASAKATNSERRHSFIPVDPAGGLSRVFAVVTDPPFVPDEHLGNGDLRELGVALVRLEFVDELQGDAEGFWDWESGEDGEFRWSGAESFLSVPLHRPFRLRLRAGHPDAGERPVRVHFNLSGGLEQELSLSDRDWHEIVIDPRRLPASALPGWHETLLPQATGILRIAVDRTWVPADFGSSDDRRALGVAVGRIEIARQEE